MSCVGIVVLQKSNKSIHGTHKENEKSRMTFGLSMQIGTTKNNNKGFTQQDTNERTKLLGGNAQITRTE